MLDKGLLRMIDANFNRAKEGLRVTEDILRFALPCDRFRKKVRRIRHSLTPLANDKIIDNAVLSRSSREDPGRKSDYLEKQRDDLAAVLSANIQRVKESLRVLEETFKLAAPNHVSRIKKLRYEVYTLEKEIVKIRDSLRAARHRDGR